MNFFDLTRRGIGFLERKLTNPKPVQSVQPDYGQSHLKIGDSLLFGNFRLNARMAVEGKTYVTIGNDCMIGGNFTFESPTGEVVIGDRVYLAGGNVISVNKVEIEDDVFISWGVYFFDNDSHSLDYRDRIEDMTNHLNDWRQGHGNYNLSKDWTKVRSAPIKVCRHAWIGMEAFILKGVTIGEGAIVGAASVVTRDVEPWTIVGGNPAKLIRKLTIPGE
jgi:acetyltransferase-like isoleucine patch superfamily enzyme